MSIFKRYKKKKVKRLKKITYPHNLESLIVQENVKLVNEAFKLYKELVKPYLQLSGKVYGNGVLDAEEADVNFWNNLTKFEAGVDSLFGSVAFKNRIKSIYERLAKKSLSEYNKISKQIVGVEVFRDSPKTEVLIKQQVKRHVGLIKNVSEELKSGIEEVVTRNASLGNSRQQMINEIEGVLGESNRGRFRKAKTRAKLIARTESAHFFSVVNREKFQQAQLETFVWQSTGDSRVRILHRELNGKVFNWTDDESRLPDGFPGETFNCRCVASIDLNEILKE